MEREGQRTNVTSQVWKTKLEPENQMTEVELEVETIGLRTGGRQNPGEAEGVEGQVQPQALMSTVKPDRPRWSQKDKGPT